MTDDFTRRSDEDIPPAEFEAEEARDDRFGNWPEIAGAALTALLLWLSFGFTG